MRALLRASDRLSDDPDDLEAIEVLLGAGTLGGARPKASVRDGRRLLVAKFPKPTDEWDVTPGRRLPWTSPNGPG